MSDLALQRIAQNKKTQNPELDLSSCQLKKIPAELLECTWLTSLGLSYNEELDDLSPIITLHGLQIIDFDSTSINDLTPLSKLNKLQGVDFSGTQVEDLTPLSTLYKLQGVDFSETPVMDLKPLSKLTNLEKVRFGNTRIDDLSPLTGLNTLKLIHFNESQVNNLSPLKTLANLEQVIFWNTPVKDLTPLSKLINLQEIDFSGTKVTSLEPISKLAALKKLYFWQTKIIDLEQVRALLNLESIGFGETKISNLAPLAQLAKLKEVWCPGTGVVDLTPLSELKNLKSLDVSYSRVADITPILHLIRQEINVNWDDLYFEEQMIGVRHCPLICPPVEIARDSPQAVRDFYEELGNDGQQLNEVKVIFLGEASAGKTSLVKRLMNEAFDSEESQTHGIRIRKLPFTMDDGDIVTAHLWDFGGQEVMHATHQFFLSQRSIYVLLLNSRNDDQAEKWLKHADSFGGRSPVLVVLNKIDENPSFEVERKSLLEKHRQIKGFYRISCAEENDQGLLEFKEALRREIDRADTRRTPFPGHWLQVKECFVKMQNDYDYIESNAFRRVCQEQGVSKPISQDVLLQFLHDLGVVINFRNLQFFDTQILNPLWLTNGVYRIINSKLVAETGGLLHEADFNAVINDPRYQNNNTTERQYQYPKNKLHYIVRVMQEFELCFMLNESTYVVPQLLPASAPDFDAEGMTLRFVVHFPEFLPNSVFPRLMVKLHAYICNSKRWRTGMILHKPNVFDALARVRWDKEDKKLLIDVCGDERRRFLSFIRETIKEIIDDFTELPFMELVPVPGCDDYQEYDYLVEAEKAGETEIFIKQLKQRVPISAMLDGVEEPSMRDKKEQLPVKAFVSYSHADLEYLKALQSALAPLCRLQKLQLWTDRSIDAGDDWRKEIFQQLEDAEIVLCLVSRDFVNSDFCYQQEFLTALEAHKCGEKTVVPIMLRNTDWQDLPLSEIQGTPGEWITSATNQDEAWTKVSKSLRPALQRAKERRLEKLEKERR